MLDVDRLKPIIILADFNEEMLKKLAGKAKIVDVKANKYIFREGDEAKKLYSVLEGRVALELSKDSTSPYRVNDIQPYHSFGVSSLVDTDEKKCISDARTIVDSKLIVWQAADLQALFEQDFKLGFLFIKKVGRIIKNRLQARNASVAKFLN